MEYPPRATVANPNHTPKLYLAEQRHHPNRKLADRRDYLEWGHISQPVTPRPEGKLLDDGIALGGSQLLNEQLSKLNCIESCAFAQIVSHDKHLQATAFRCTLIGSHPPYQTGVNAGAI